MTRRRAAYCGGTALLGVLFGGWVGLVVGAAVGIVASTRPGWLLVAAATAPWVLALTTLVEARTTERNIARFAALHPLGHHLGIVAALLWIAAGLVLILGHAGSGSVTVRSGADPADRGRAPWWLLAALALAAVLGTLVLID